MGKALGLPRFVWERKPFPGPALTARVIGEATPARIATEVKGVVSVTYNVTPKPPSTIEAV